MHRQSHGVRYNAACSFCVRLILFMCHYEALHDDDIIICKWRIVDCVRIEDAQLYMRDAT
jgi:hypothetical protein